MFGPAPVADGGTAVLPIGYPPAARDDGVRHPHLTPSILTPPRTGYRCLVCSFSPGPQACVLNGGDPGLHSPGGAGAEGLRGGVRLVVSRGKGEAREGARG